jgi:hypothetical protein
VSYLTKLKQKIGDEIPAEAPAKPAEGAFAGSAGTGPAIVLLKCAIPVQLDQLIYSVARLHGFTPAQLREAREIASGDLANAWTCFQRLAPDADVVNFDDRVKCSDCARLVGRRCAAAAQGLMADSYAGYSPVPDILRNCEHFKKK